jgi:hypothetical protein
MLKQSQQKAYDKIYNFFQSNESIFYLVGYAGTGKTHLITQIINNLLHEQENSLFISTTLTHKALSVIRSSFQKLGYKISCNDENDNMIINDKNILQFTTLHKLLGYVASYDDNGNKEFVPSNKVPESLKLTNLKYIFIDECSMISSDMVDSILNIPNINKSVKIIVIGDPAQLNPVNEIDSKIFDVIPDDYEHFHALKKVLRTNNIDIANICKIIRRWTDENLLMMLKNYQCYNNKVLIHIDNDWLTSYQNHLSNDVVPLILTWTNKKCQDYNNQLRTLIHKKNNLNELEIGDYLIFNDFYKAVDGIKIYTSTQVKIEKIFDIETSKGMWSNTYGGEYGDLVASFINTLNQNHKYTYQYRTLVVRILNSKDSCLINVLLEKEKTKHYKNCENIRKSIITFCNMVKTKKISLFLWGEFYRMYIDMYADVTFSFSLTTHKAQASSYNIVYVDVSDIMKNKNKKEMKRCLYTASSRPSEELHFIF